MKLIAAKPMVYDGVRYEAGEPFNPSLISDKRIRTLVNARLLKYADNGGIAFANDAVSPTIRVEYAKNGKMLSHDLSADEVSAIFKVLQSPLASIDAALLGIEDEDLADVLLSVEKRAGAIAKINKKFHD